MALGLFAARRRVGRPLRVGIRVAVRDMVLGDSTEVRGGRRGKATPVRLRRQLLAQAVQENLYLIRGERPARQTPRRAGRWTGVLFAALAVATAAAAWQTWRGRELALTRSAAQHGAAGESTTPNAATPAPTLSGAALAAVPPTRLAREVLPLAVRRIVVDPGHGGTDLGTQAPNGLLEKDVTLDLAKRLRALLVADGFEVRLTREDDRRVSLRERAQLANRLPADAFLSIHLNWIADQRRSRGVETYTLGPTDDPYLTQLASAENAESGYSRADVRVLLERIYDDLRREESHAEALAVHHRLFSSLSEISPTLEDRGVKAAPFLVLVATEMPAALAEVTCLSNDEEAARLADPTYRDRIAQALRQGLAAYARGPQKDQGKRSG